MSSINIGDRIGYMLRYPPILEDIQGIQRKRRGDPINLTPTFADVLDIMILPSLFLLNLRVHTRYGVFIRRNVRIDEDRLTPDTWFSLKETSLQPSLYKRKIIMYMPGGGSSLGQFIGGTLNSFGVISHPPLSASSRVSMSRRTLFTSSLINTAGGIMSAHEICWRGNSNDIGGFFFTAKFSQAANLRGSRSFIGLSALTNSVVNSDPSSTLNTIGVGYDSKDSNTGNWYFISSNPVAIGGPLKIDLVNMPRNTNSIYELIMQTLPNNGISVTITDSTSDKILFKMIELDNLPNRDAFLRLHAAALPTLAGPMTQFQIHQIYIDTDL